MFKKKRWIIAVVLVSVILAALLVPNLVYRINEGLVEQEVVIDDIDVSSLNDNTFTGSYQSGHMSADVTVTIENGEYVSVVLTDYSGINPSRAQQVINSVVENQTLLPDDGDIGTEYTDKIVLKAIYYAIMYNYASVS